MDIGDVTRIALDEDPDLVEPALAYVWLSLDAEGRVSGGGTVRPGLSRGAYLDVLDWADMRVQRAVHPDGSEPDVWYLSAGGRYEAWAVLVGALITSRRRSAP